MAKKFKGIYCYCKSSKQRYCGKCIVCGKSGHTRAIMFFTGSWCSKHYHEALKRLNKE